MLNNFLNYLKIILPFLIFLIFRSIFFTPIISDETIYINMAKALGEGLLPYKDFFFAHPILQLLLLYPITQTNNFFIVKIFVSMIGLASIFFTYLIAKKIFDEKSAYISVLFTLFFPGFIIFGNLAMGTFEAVLFLLLSFYFLLHGKVFLSSIFLSLSIFTRYLVLLFLPFIIFYTFKFYRKQLKKFSIFLALNLIFLSAIFLLIFGFDFIKDTVFYHFESNIKLPISLANWVLQYLSLGFFTLFICFISLVFGYFKKDFMLLAFSIFILFYDITILLIFRQVIYHYFAFTIPFLSIVFGRIFYASKFLELKFFIILILLLSIISNYRSLIYYFDYTKNLVFDDAANYTLKLAEKNDLIFGEPRVVNYVSFVTGRKIVNNYFDSDLKFINFYGRDKVLNQIEKAKPKILFVDDQHYSFLGPILNNYKLIKEWNVPEYYHLYLFELNE
jgi:4-amino-4-deoxy-L-arabinose transferase-like glycosyltransferase